MCSDDTYHSPHFWGRGGVLTCFVLLHWIEKWSSRGRLLKHLESFGTKIMMSGHNARQVWEDSETNKDRRSSDECHGLYEGFALPVHYLSEVFKACLESFF